MGRRKEYCQPKKHGVSFEEASRILDEESTLDIFDADHSAFEDRFISIDPVRKELLLVIWTEREEEVIRIISARRATSHEAKLYHEYMEKKHE